MLHIHEGPGLGNGIADPSEVENEGRKKGKGSKQKKRVVVEDA